MDIKKLDKEVCGEIWSSDSMMELLRKIASFDNRFTGSPGEKAAQKIVMERLTKWGLDTRFQRFKIRTWIRGSSSLRIPAKNLNLPCKAFVFSKSTGGKPKTLEVIDIHEGSRGDFKRSEGKIRGKAVLFSRKNYEELEDPCDTSRYATATSRYVTALEAGAEAFIVGTYRSPGVISTTSLKLRDSGSASAVAVGVSGESVALIRRAMRSGARKISISTSCKAVDKYSGNLIGYIPGRRSDQEIILGAHLDTFDLSPGADDNGSGVAVVCELARLLVKYRGKLERPIRIVLFTGEELGRRGSEKYARSIKDTGKVGVYFNFDLPANGGYPRLYSMTGKSDPELWQAIAEKMCYRFPVKEILSRASDQYSFYRRGIPSIWEITWKSGTRSPAALHHTALDTLEYVNPNELKEAATMAAKIVLYLAQMKDFPFEPLTPVPEDSGRYTDG